MDDKIAAVLDAYHARIREEQKMRAAGRPAPADEQAWLDKQLLAVGPNTGQLINIIAKAFTKPTILEIGTSYGYSGIWLAEAARATGGKLITLELADYKSAYAREMAAKAGLAR